MWQTILPVAASLLSTFLSKKGEQGYQPVSQVEPPKSNFQSPYPAMNSWFTGNPMLPQQLSQGGQQPPQQQPPQSQPPAQQPPQQPGNPLPTQQGMSSQLLGNPQFNSLISQLLSQFGRTQ